MEEEVGSAAPSTSNSSPGQTSGAHSSPKQPAEQEKKKKRKSKKKEEEAPPPEPEPKPAPAHAPAPDAAEDDEWPPKFSDEPPPEEAAEGEAPAPGEEGEPPAEGEEGAPLEEDEPQPIEKRKSPYPVFWNRPKAKMYSMNFDYGENYYRSMVNYLDHKSNIGRRGGEIPKAESWAERAHKSAAMRYPKQDTDISNLLLTVRSNIRCYDAHHKQYTTKIQNVYGPKAY